MKKSYIIAIITTLTLCFLISMNIFVKAEEVKEDVYVPWITNDPEVNPGEITTEPIEEEKIEVGKTEEEIKDMINKIKVDHAPDPLKIDIGTSDINYYYTSARLKDKETIDISKDKDDAKLIILSALRQYKSWLVNNSVIGTYNSNSDTEMRIYNKISSKTTSYSKFNKVKTIAVNDSADSTSLYIKYDTGECYSIVSLKGEKESDTKTSCVVYYKLSDKDLKALHDAIEGKVTEEETEEIDEELIEGLEDEESDLTHKANVPLANILFIIFIILIVGGTMFFLIVKIKAFMMETADDEDEDDEEDDNEDDEEKDNVPEVKLFGKEKDDNAFDESEYKR